MEKTFNEKRTEFVGLLNGLETSEAVLRLLELSEELLKKAKKGSGIKKDSSQQIFRTLLIEAMDTEGELSEKAIFDKFGYGFGRHEALTACRNMHIRVAEGEDMLWAQDVVKEDGTLVYKILGIGEEMPEAYQIRRKKATTVVEAEEAEVVDPDFESEIANGIDIH